MYPDPRVILVHVCSYCDRPDPTLVIGKEA